MDEILALYGYQELGVKWLLQRGRGILADDMGLGKTAQSLTAMKQTGAKRVMVVCPRSIRQVWRHEIPKWLGPEPVVKVVSGVRMMRELKLREEANYYILGYEHMSLHQRSLLELPFDGFIFDEAHRLKNREAKRTMSSQVIMRSHRMTPLHLLTGTPVLNRPDEIWTLLNMISPYDFPSYWQFVDEYLETEEVYIPGKGRVKQVKYDTLDRVIEVIKPFLLRRLKRDCLELPEKTFQSIEVELEGRQLLAYEQMKNEMFMELGDDREINASVIIAWILRLKQIAVSHLLPNKWSQEIEGAKIDALFDILEDVGDQKVVIFSQFSTVIDRLLLKIRKAGYSAVKLTGDTSDKERERLVDEFQGEGGPQVFLTTIQAGGLGITLTAASVAVFMDLYWTPAINAQAEDRLHRIGQKNPVTIYSLEAANTIEGWILSLLQSKKEMFDALVPVERVTLDQLTKKIRSGDKELVANGK